jgi:tetratricopeptide (TPR) repeat protein
MGYAEPGPHMALAKYFWQKGDRLQAFLLLEYARRTRFREAQFNAAFEKEFGQRGPIESKPGEVAFNKAVELQRAGNTKQAEEYFVRAAELSPHSVEIQSWVGRFFFKVIKNDQRALQFYLNAYFLNPHAYETEFVESRIRTINFDEASLRYRLLMQQGASLEEILKHPNPTVIVLALEYVSSAWCSTDYTDRSV